ncbi:MAG: FAD-dependent oxidoreductase, partial [Desulforhabdus sp.]|nr:FAD-dependent oxidoreductase [Desulforhabdus sp.]
MREREKIGAVTIVGGGIAGIQSALDIANSGFKVYLVEEQPSVGGTMAQLDKTFPTNDCSSCMMGPKLVELANHRNVDILAYSELLDVTGEPGNFKAVVRKKARAVDPEKCVGCGICAAKCPIRVPDPFNCDLCERKAITVLFPQAVPHVYTIDKEHCLYFTKGKCRICQKVCKNDAIRYDQQDEIVQLDTGAVILAGGFKPFDPRLKPEYGYGLWPNVVTNLEYERILSAAGPFHGHIQRISDGRKPDRVAWIQCVGSRDVSIGQDYCSYVCCMYATKQAMITKEHEPDIETTIFYIDMRAQGKGFDRFYERARNESGVRYIRSMVSRIVPVPETNRLQIDYIDPRDGSKREEFDLAVLSLGLCAHPSSIKLATRLGVELDRHGFCKTNPLDQVETSRPGIYVCGVFQGPKDIPETVQQASSAAARATALLADSRGSLVRAKAKPVEERDVSGEQPRVGVFVCHCGINIAGVIEVEQVAAYARSLPGVAYASDCMFACSTEQQKEIKRAIDEHRLNRIVVASCTPRTHEPLFRNTLKEAGLNPYLFELANIREQDSWVHQKEPQPATEKAKDLVRMAVSRISLLEPLRDLSCDVEQSALVIGGGLAGLTAALGIAEEGFYSVLVEASDELGGNARTLHYTEDGARPAEYVQELIAKVEAHPLVSVYKEARIVSLMGSCGDFTTLLSIKGRNRQVSHGVVIVATGGTEYKPTEYEYGKDPRIVTQKELEAKLMAEPDRAEQLRDVVMIQCVGSREPDHSYCSRVCCMAAIKNSLKLKELNPRINISVLYRDIRSFGFKEQFYQQARRKGVRFFRFETDKKPQ